MNNIKRRSARLLTASLFIAAPLPAQTGDEPAGRGQESGAIEFKVPRLGGHTFIPNTLQEEPFIVTSVRSSVGIGKSLAFELPPVEIGGDTIDGLRGDLFFALLEFEYQQAIKSWLAVRGQFRVAARLGDGVQSLLTQGVTAATGFEFGWLIRILRSERTMLSGSLNVWNNNFTAINLRRFIEDVIEIGQGELVRKTPAIRGGGGLRFAWGASDLIGVTAYAETGYGESVDRRSQNEWFYTFGGTLNIDAGARTAVPLGFVLGYRQDSFPEGGEDIADDARGVFLGIAYAGRPDFSISLEFSFERLPLRDLDETLSSASTLINLRYFF